MGFGQTTLPLDKIYTLMRQPVTPEIKPDVYAAERERVSTQAITSDWFRQVAGQMNEFAKVKQQQQDAYAQRTAQNQESRVQALDRQDAIDTAGQQNVARAAQLGERQKLLEAYARESDDTLPTETPADEALVEEASGNGGFFSGLKDIGKGAIDLGRGAAGLAGSPIKELLETPVEVGRELVTGGGIKGIRRELAEGVAPLTEPVEAAFEIAREAIRGDLQGLVRELKEAGQEIPQAQSLVRAWDGMNQIFLGEQKIITPLTRPIIQETMETFGVPHDRARSIANIVAEILVPTSFIPIFGQLGKTKGFAKLLKASLSEGSINMLQNKAGVFQREGRDTTLIEDITMFSFGMAGRVGLEYAARGLSKFLTQTETGQAISRGATKVVGAVKDAIRPGRATEDLVTVFHGTGGKLEGDSLTGGSFVTTDRAAAQTYAGVDARLRAIQGKPVQETVYETQVPRSALVDAPEDATTLGSPFVLREDTPMRPSVDAEAPARASVDEPEEMLSLEHYSGQKLDEIDPSFAGTGRAGEEANIGGPRVSHYYLSGAKPEKMIVDLPNRMTVEVPKSQVLDLSSEEGVALSARASASKTGGVAANMGDTRQLAQAEGWKGIYNSEDSLKRVQLFDTATVRPDTQPGRFSRAVADTQANKGGTFDSKTGESVSGAGYHVGGGVPTKTIPLAEFNEEAMHVFVRENAKAFNDPVVKVGTEVIDNASGKTVVNLDATSIITKRDEAMGLAQTRGEERVWDTVAGDGSGRTIEVPGVQQTQKTPAPKSSGRVPNAEIRTQADDYVSQANLPALTDLPYAKVDEPRATRIADAYENATHLPNDPKVKRAYEAFKQETHKQWEYLKAKGIKFTPWTEKGQPYANSAEMRADIADNKHLSFFQGGDLPADHPMAAKVPGSDLTYNDEFRAVHDYFGHAKEGFEFGPRGEENAWRTHSQMFGDEARKAVTTETRGQNSWVNFGPDGKANRADPTNTKFPDQKATLLPDEFVELADDVKPPTTTKPPAKAAAGDEVIEKLADYTPDEKAVVRTIVTAKKSQIGSAAHAWVSEAQRAIVKVYNAIKKMGRTFHQDELGALRTGKADKINGVTYANIMNIGASRRWLHPTELWPDWSRFMQKRVGGKSANWMSTMRNDVREYTEHMMGLIGEGPVGGGVKLGDDLTARYGPAAGPRTYAQLIELVEEGSRLQTATGVVDMKKWYDDFLAFMDDSFGVDADIMIMFAAVTQSNQSPANGVAGALRAFIDWKLGLPIRGQGSATIRKAMEEVIRGGVPKGPKINPFWKALGFGGKRGQNSVAVDRWILAAIGAQEGRWKNLASNKPFMRFAQQLVREAADEAGIHPRSFQAALWGGERVNWDKIRQAAGMPKKGTDSTFFHELFRARMADNGMRAPKDFNKLGAQAELFDIEELEQHVVTRLQIAVAGEKPAQRSARLTKLMYAEWNEKISAAHLLETGEIPDIITDTVVRERVTHQASMYKRNFADRLLASDTGVLTSMEKKGRLPKWQKDILTDTIEARQGVMKAPQEHLKALPRAERTRLKELGYDHLPEGVNELKRVHNEFLALDKIRTVPTLTAWLKRNKDIAGNPLDWVGKRRPSGRTYINNAGKEVRKHEMSPYWEPKPFYDTGYRLNIDRIKSVLKARYPDQRLIDGTKQTLGDAMKIADKSPVGACA